MTSDSPSGLPVGHLMADAVRVLTEAARLTWSTTGPDGEPVTVRVDFAEFATHALAGAAANAGGIEQLLAGRPGSWEADGLRQLLHSTVGSDEEHLLEHRTEPVVVDLCVDEILADLGAWTAYYEAQHELAHRNDAVAPLGVTTAEQERQADAIADPEDQLEELREQDWTDYGQALEAAVKAAARRRPGLRVPVIVRVDLHSVRTSLEGLDGWTWDVAEQLRTAAIDTTPLPGDGRRPLDRLRAAAAAAADEDDHRRQHPEEGS